MAAKKPAKKAIANPGAKLGQAIGEMMERALAARMRTLAIKHKCHYLGPDPDPEVGKVDLKLQDEFGTEYNVDAVIANESLQPLVLLESKYIRYKKHNRDKGSWICHAHRSLRNRFHSVRKSIAVLAGSWTQSSVAMIQSARVVVFLVPFEKIAKLLAEQGVDFEWDEKDRDTAVFARMTYERLPLEVKRKIADSMIADIERPFCKAIDSALQSDAVPEIAEVLVEFHADTGEIRRKNFDTVEDAALYLNSVNAADVFDIKGAPTIPTVGERKRRKKRKG